MSDSFNLANLDFSARVLLKFPVKFVYVLNILSSNKLQRYDIVNGAVEVDGATNEASMDQGGDKVPAGTL